VTAASDSTGNIGAERQKAIGSMFANLPEAGSERTKALQAIRGAFYAELAKQYEPVMNEFVRVQPQVTKEDRSNLATTINRMVRELGLSVKCPRTNLPATLIVDSKREGDKVICRYRYKTINAAGEHKPTFTCYEFPDLELCQAALRVESLAKGFKKRGDGRVR
jgi:hypothetical protein